MIEYVIYALSRSGHHAFCEWVAEGIPSNVAYYNNAVLGWKDGNMLSAKPHPKKIINNDLPLFVKMCSVETFDVDYFTRYNLLNFEYNLLNFDVRHHVLFIREFRNWVASVFVGGSSGKEELTKPFTDQLGNVQESTVSLWRKQARLFLNPPNGVVCVFYDRWLSDEEYKCRISKQLGIPNLDTPVAMSKHGGGSSFTGNNGGEFDSNVFRRYEQLRDNEEYNKILKDNPECLKLSEELFSV